MVSFFVVSSQSRCKSVTSAGKRTSREWIFPCPYGLCDSNNNNKHRRHPFIYGRQRFWWFVDEAPGKDFIGLYSVSAFRWRKRISIQQWNARTHARKSCVTEKEKPETQESFQCSYIVQFIHGCRCFDWIVSVLVRTYIKRITKKLDLSRSCHVWYDVTWSLAPCVSRLWINFTVPPARWVPATTANGTISGPRRDTGRE